MQISNHLMSSTQGFSSPLRLIDQNAPTRIQTSPNCFQSFSSGPAHRLKRRLTQIESQNKPENPLFKSIKISYK